MDLQQLAAAAREDLGEPDTWAVPAGYPDSLALAVIDSIQSIGVTYISVVNVLNGYREYRRAEDGDPNADTPADLVASFDSVGGAQEWANRIGNQNRTSTARHAPLKAAVIEQAARMLVEGGITTGAEFLAASAGPGHQLKDQWHALPGQKYGTSWAYVHILLGAEEVKPDRMIQGWLARRLGPEGARLNASGSAQAIRDLAAHMGVSERVLEHNVWRFEQETRLAEGRD